MSENPEEEPSPAPDLQQRLAAEIAAGRTVSLSAEEMADPELRRRLPRMLAELTGAAGTPVGPGLRLPGYTVLGVIGQGGMSTVYLARQDTLGRYVALKVSSWSGADRKKRDRLVQEARAMARVAHPNIVAIHDIVDVGDTVGLAMEWIDGMTLEALLRALPRQPGAGDMDVARAKLGTAPEAEASFGTSSVRFFVRVMLDVARAVHRVHQAGLLHLDIKPSNVLIRRDGTPLLADFGIVREIDLAPANTRSFAGTPIYCAPEQLRTNDRVFGPHTDVYGLGITLYEVLARRQPLLGQDLTRLVQIVEKGRIPALGTEISIAKDLETIVHKALAPEPQHRYASAAEFADDLEAFLEGRPVAARPLSRVRRLQRWARLEPWKAALLAVLLVTLPVVTYLGVELLLGMPHIAAGRLRERSHQANDLKGTAYQLLFAGLIDVDEAMPLLHRAMALDPSDTSLACLASLMLDYDHDAVVSLLERHPRSMARSRGLQLLATKARERRPFFTAEEATELAHSSRALDWYLLALDRVIWAEDTGGEAAYEQALLHIDAAAIGREPDHLLMGLRSWVASFAGLREVQEATCRAMREVWPGSEVTLRWDCLTHEMHDPEAAEATAKDRIAQDPRCTAAWELLVGAALRQGKDAEGLELAERARAVPVSSPSLDSFYVALLVANRQLEQAQQMLAAMPQSGVAFAYRMRFSRRDGLAATRKLCNEELAAPVISRRRLHTITLEANRMRDLDLGRRAFARWHRDYPGYRYLYRFEVQRLYFDRDVLGAARLAREVSTPLHRIDSDAPILCGLFATASYWRTWPNAGRCTGRRRIDRGRRPTPAWQLRGSATSRPRPSSSRSRPWLPAPTSLRSGTRPRCWNEPGSTWHRRRRPGCTIPPRHSSCCGGSRRRTASCASRGAAPGSQR